MSNTTLIGPWVRRFLMEHLIGDRNLARHTQMSYRDALVLLLPFVSTIAKKPVDRLSVEDLSPSAVRRFLEYLENDRGCSIVTRNQRLGAIHTFARCIGMRSPEHLAWCTEIQAIPFKKAPKPMMTYLDKPEMHALLKAPDQRTGLGPRDHALLLFLYNTGARAGEAARLIVADLALRSSPSVRIVGKGNKTRHCPLWPTTANALNRIVAGRDPHEAVFLNRQHRPITRFGIHALVKRYIAKVSCQMPSLHTKQISTHTIRHTTAVHLLRAGVDINTIRAWLGHVSLDTTNIYTEIDLEMKAKALACCEIPEETTSKRWRKEPNLIAFLRAL